VLLAAAAGAATAQEGYQAVDRILAVVDEDPILASELEQVIALRLVERRGEEESEEAFRRRVLDRLIEQRLRFHEIDRFGFAEVPIDEVERQYAAFRAEFPSDEAFARHLEELGLDETALRRLVARQVMVVTYVEERLGPRVFVGLDDITAYYNDVLAPEMGARGQPLPPIQEVREAIREVLRQERLNREIERWTEELRRKAEVEDYLGSGRDAPPS
jgi:hypothetical protein